MLQGKKRQHMQNSKKSICRFTQRGNINQSLVEAVFFPANGFPPVNAFSKSKVFGIEGDSAAA